MATPNRPLRTFLAVLGIAGGGVLLVLLAVAIAVSTIDPNVFVGPIQERVKIATGRKLTVGGGVELKLGLLPRLVLNDVHVGNAPWAKAPDLLAANKIEAEVALFPLLQRRFELLRLNVVEPVIALETDGQGRGNWELAAMPGSGGATTAGAEPMAFGMGNLAVTRGQLTYRDGATGAETHIAIDQLSLMARDAESPVNAEFRGSVDGIAVALTGNLGPLATLAQRRLPYPVMVQGEVDGRKAAVAAKVRRADGVVVLSDLDVTSGSSNAKGQVEIVDGGPRATWKFQVEAPMLAVEDLPLPGAVAPVAKPAAGAASEGGPFLIGDVALRFEALRARDAEGDVTVGRLVLPGGRRLEGVRVRFTLHGGKLHASAIRATMFGGEATGELRVDATPGQIPAIAIKAKGRGLDVAALLAAAGVKREVRGGKTDVDVDVTMHGNSPRQWAGNISGNVQAVVGTATIAAARLDLALPFDRLTQYVNPVHAAGLATEMQCVVIRLPLAGGIARIDRTMAFETRDIDATASGTLDFRHEMLDLTLRPRLRHGLPAGVPQVADLVRLSGTFASPTVGVDALGVAVAAGRIGAAIGTMGLSALGESLLAAGGPGACTIALGNVPGAAPAGAATAKRGSAPTPAADSGKVLR